tara:strand:+ start:200 stop:643 length:444 start_codon:yes stop_codon:yes gene_type:complete
MNNSLKEFRFDLNQLHKMTVGFDRLFDQMLLAGEYPNTVSTGYPPYNVERVTDDSWRVTIAVAGFGEDDIEVIVDQGNLNINGKKDDKNGDNMLYKGIANRQFNRSFQLADYVEVDEASLKDGMLTLNLVRNVPEALKPKKIKLISK